MHCTAKLHYTAPLHCSVVGGALVHSLRTLIFPLPPTCEPWRPLTWALSSRPPPPPPSLPVSRGRGSRARSAPLPRSPAPPWAGGWRGARWGRAGPWPRPPCRPSCSSPPSAAPGAGRSGSAGALYAVLWPFSLYPPAHCHASSHQQHCAAPLPALH